MEEIILKKEEISEDEQKLLKEIYKKNSAEQIKQFKEYKENIIKEINNIIFFQSDAELEKYELHIIYLNLKIFPIKNIFLFYNENTLDKSERLRKELLNNNKNLKINLIRINGFYKETYRKLMEIFEKNNHNFVNTIIDTTLGTREIANAFDRFSIEHGVRTISWNSIQTGRRRIPSSLKINFVPQPKKRNKQFFMCINNAIENYNFHGAALLYNSIFDEDLYRGFMHLSELYSENSFFDDEFMRERYQEFKNYCRASKNRDKFFNQLLLFSIIFSKDENEEDSEDYYFSEGISDSVEISEYLQGKKSKKISEMLSAGYQLRENLRDLMILHCAAAKKRNKEYFIKGKLLENLEAEELLKKSNYSLSHMRSFYELYTENLEEDTDRKIIKNFKKFLPESLLEDVGETLTYQNGVFTLSGVSEICIDVRKEPPLQQYIAVNRDGSIRRKVQLDVLEKLLDHKFISEKELRIIFGINSDSSDSKFKTEYSRTKTFFQGLEKELKTILFREDKDLNIGQIFHYKDEKRKDERFFEFVVTEISSY